MASKERLLWTNGMEGRGVTLLKPVENADDYLVRIQLENLGDLFYEHRLYETRRLWPLDPLDRVVIRHAINLVMERTGLSNYHVIEAALSHARDKAVFERRKVRKAHGRTGVRS